MATLTVSDLDKYFGPVHALRRVSLEVPDGRFTVLVGPSGCGKSTLLQVVAGLIAPDHGSVHLDNRRVDSLAPRERDVAMVFQNYALYPHMTVFENLEFGLRMRSVSKGLRRQKVLETAAMLGIESVLGRKPAELSGGQRQRVAMGRALVRQPKIFLLDEPLSNLDAQLRVSVRLELKRIHQQFGSTILYVTHDQAEAMTLGDEVVVMKEGRIHQTGPPEEVYEHPADEFVAAFIGSPAMNMFPGCLVRSPGGWQFLGTDIRLRLDGVDKSREGAEVRLGIRPEDVVIAGKEEKGVTILVEMTSNVGPHKYIHGRLGKLPLTIRTPKDQVYGPGNAVRVRFPPSRVHLFQAGYRIPQVLEADANR